MIVKEFTTRFKSALLAILSLALLGTPQAISQDKAPPAVATQAPAVTVAIANFDKFLPDVIYLLRAAGFQPQAGMFTFFANQYSQGLDRTRAIAVTVDLPPGALEPKVFVMLPIKDLDVFFGAVSNIISKDETTKDHYILTASTAPPFYAVYEKQWLVVTQREDDLPLHPAAPNLLTDPLTKNYDLAVNLNLNSVPEDSKKEIIANLEQGFKSGFTQNSSMTPEEAAVARKQGELALEQVKDLINDTDQVVIGIAADRGAKFLALDIASKFDPGSKMAQQISLLTGLQSSLGAVVQSTDPIQMSYRSKLTKEEIERMNSNLDTYLMQMNNSLKKSVADPKGREVVASIATVLIESLKSTMSDGEVDSASAINFTNGINVISYSRVANSNELEKKLIGLLRKYQGEANAPKIAAQAQDYLGMKLYTGTWTVPKDKDMDDIRKILGETVSFTFAFGKNHAGLAVGTYSEKDLKAAIDRAQKAQPAAANPFNLSIELLPILQYAAPLVKDPKANSILQATIAKVSEFENNDKLKVESRAGKDGIVIRTTLEEGVLQSIGASIMAAAAPPPAARK